MSAAARRTRVRHLHGTPIRHRLPALLRQPRCACDDGVCVCTLCCATPRLLTLARPTHSIFVPFSSHRHILPLTVMVERKTLGGGVLKLPVFWPRFGGGLIPTFRIQERWGSGPESSVMDIAIGTTRAQKSQKSKTQRPSPRAVALLRALSPHRGACLTRTRAACRRGGAPLRAPLPALPRTAGHAAHTCAAAGATACARAAGAARAAQAQTVSAVGARAARAAPRRRRAAHGFFLIYAHICVARRRGARTRRQRGSGAGQHRSSGSGRHAACSAAALLQPRGRDCSKTRVRCGVVVSRTHALARTTRVLSYLICLRRRALFCLLCARQRSSVRG
jgi:hypothetical protein